MATDINILIKATDQATPAIKKVEGGLKDIGTQAKSSGNALSGIGNVMKAGLTTALVGAAAAVGGLVFAFKDSFAAAKEAQDAHKQLVAVLTSTGGAAGVTTTMALDLANSLSLVTNYGDDTIVTGENMLLTFTNIGKDVFPRATETMLDMSQALGTDLAGSAVQLGKALNDPIAGISALSRVGVTFTDDQKAMIQSMMDTNDIAGAQTVILDELAKEFGGSAKALADPFTQLQNQWGEVQEAVGTGLMPVLIDLARTVLPYVQAAAQAVGLAFQTFYDNLDSGLGPLEAARQAIYDVLPDDLKQKWLDISGDIMGTLNTMVGNVQNAMGWIKLAWDSNWHDMRVTIDTFTTETPGQVQMFWDEVKRLFTVNGAQLNSDWAFLWGYNIVSALTGAVTVIIANATLMFTALNGIFHAGYSLIHGDWQGFWDGLYDVAESVTDAMLNMIEYIFGPNLRDAFAGALNGVWDTLKSWWSDIQSWWNSTVGSLPGMMATPLAIVNPVNVSGGGGGGGGGGFSGTTNNIVVNTTGGYDNGVAAGDGIADALRFRGH